MDEARHENDPHAIAGEAGSVDPARTPVRGAQPMTATPVAAPITLIEAITQALAWELQHDPAVLVLGEDVGVNGGVFRATAGLQQRFGAQRVLDTPLDETTIAGLSVGLAAQGMKPVAEAQFDGFVYPMVDHLVCHAARLRNRTRGRLHCPLVLRVPWGGGIRAPEHHSEANEAIFTNVPGLRVVMPSSPQRAYGMLLAAIRDPDPVIYMEPKRIYRQYKELVPDDGEALPLDVCYVLRDGADVTLVTWGAQVKETLEAAEKLAAELPLADDQPDQSRIGQRRARGDCRAARHRARRDLCRAGAGPRGPAPFGTGAASAAYRLAVVAGGGPDRAFYRRGAGLADPFRR